MKSIRLEGIVIEGPIICDNVCSFMVQTDDGIYYQVISNDGQAIKDNVFVVPGENIVINGVEIINEGSKKVLVSKKSKIILKK